MVVLLSHDLPVSSLNTQPKPMFNQNDLNGEKKNEEQRTSSDIMHERKS